jgi:hypothetical protein
VKKFITPAYTYEYYFKPLENETELVQLELLSNLEVVARACFNTVPEYQCFKSLKDKVIVIVKTREGKPVSFSSSILLEVGDGENILHQGLVCTDHEYRNKGIFLYSCFIQNILIYIKKFRLKKMWITSCSCEISVLKAVGRFFKDVYPSPYIKSTTEHLRIAKEINDKKREELWINSNVQFDFDSFIFKGSVGDNPFRKDLMVSSNYDEEESFYLSKLDYARGDEFLQIGYWDYEAFKKAYKSIFKRLLKQTLKKTN